MPDQPGKIDGEDDVAELHRRAVAVATVARGIRVGAVSKEQVSVEVLRAAGVVSHGQGGVGFTVGVSALPLAAAAVDDPYGVDQVLLAQGFLTVRVAEELAEATGRTVEDVLQQLGREAAR